MLRSGYVARSCIYKSGAMTIPLIPVIILGECVKRKLNPGQSPYSTIPKILRRVRRCNRVVSMSGCSHAPSRISGNVYPSLGIRYSVGICISGLRMLSPLRPGKDNALVADCNHGTYRGPAAPYLFHDSDSLSCMVLEAFFLG
jgi:hypothetical protein